MGINNKMTDMPDYTAYNPEEHNVEELVEIFSGK
jgi:hypothetical protein